MNISNTMGLSPTSFRRVLTAHGRSTTPGLLAYPSCPAPDNSKPRKVETPSNVSASVLEVAAVAVQAKASRTSEVKRPVAPVVQEVSHTSVAAPVEKIEEPVEKKAVNSVSFYKRPFRVHGEQAWEYAMRDLGSIDTLLNRYGYVTPGQRQKTSS